MKALIFVVFSTIVVYSEGLRKGIRTAKAQTPLDYYNQVIQLFEEKVKGYGYESLPVADYSRTLNQTVYGVELLGETKYSNGLVDSMNNCSNIDRYFIAGEYHGAQSISGRFNLSFISVSYDLAATLKVGDVSCSATHVFPINEFELIINRSISSEEVNGYLHNVSIDAPKTTYVPDTDVTRALARVARLTASSPFALNVGQWTDDIFSTMIDAIVKELPFPL